MSTLRKFAAQSDKSPSSQPPLVPYPDSESMDGDSAEETTGPAIENGHSTDDNRTSVDKYFLGPEVNDNIPGSVENITNRCNDNGHIFAFQFVYLGLNISTGHMEPCADQIQCESSNVTDQVFSPNESYDTNENNSVSILMDGLVQNQNSVSYGTDIPNNSGLPPPPVHQMVPPIVQTNQPSRESSSPMICLDDADDDVPPNVEPNHTNGQAPAAPEYPDDANYYMPSDEDTEVVKVWSQFPQWSRYCAKKKSYSATRRALLEGRDLNSGINKLVKPRPGHPNEAYLANEQVDFNCFFEFGK